MKRFCSLFNDDNKLYEFCAVPSSEDSGNAVVDEVWSSSSAAPIVSQAPQIFYGSVFPDKKGRMNHHGGSAKGPIRAYQGASDFFLGSGDELKFIDDLDLDFEAELAIITDAVPAGVSVVEAENYIKILTACNDFTYRKLASTDRESGFGFIQSKPLTSFCRFGVLPNANKAMWNNGMPILELEVAINDEIFCAVSTGDMLYGFPELVAYCAKTRDLPAGTIITSGAISTYGSDSLSHGCIAEKRRCVKLKNNISGMEFLKAGDLVKIDFYFLDDAEDIYPKSLFGTLENRVMTL